MDAELTAPSPNPERAAARLLDVAPRLTRLISAEAQASDAAGSLTVTQLRILGRLERGPRLASELARELRVSPATASEVVDLLVRRGLIARGTPVCDRRQTPLLITPAGAELSVAARARALAKLRGLLDTLGPVEVATVEAALGLIEKMLAAEAANGEGDRAG